MSGYRLYRRHRPDVVIVDLALRGGGLGGLDVIRRIRSHDPRARILVLSMHSDPIIAARALEAGANGYVLKDTSADELMRAFAQVRAGTPYLSNDLAMQVALVRTGARSSPLAAADAARAADAVAAGGREALRAHRRGAQRQLQDGGQCLRPAQAQAQCEEPAGPDPARGPEGRGPAVGRRIVERYSSCSVAWPPHCQLFYSDLPKYDATRRRKNAPRSGGVCS